MISENTQQIKRIRRYLLIFSLIIVFIMILSGCEVKSDVDSSYFTKSKTEADVSITHSDLSDYSEEPQTIEAISDTMSTGAESELPTQESNNFKPKTTNSLPIKHSVPVNFSENETLKKPIKPMKDSVKQPNTEPKDEELVKILDYIPTVYIELKYATTDNFTGQIVYDFTDAYLRYGTIKKLKAVQEELSQKGYSLKIWDAYRPVSAQFALWNVCPNPVYVANPNTGYSSHSTTNAPRSRNTAGATRRRSARIGSRASFWERSKSSCSTTR